MSWRPRNNAPPPRPVSYGSLYSQAVDLKFGSNIIHHLSQLSQNVGTHPNNPIKLYNMGATNNSKLHMIYYGPVDLHTIGATLKTKITDAVKGNMCKDVPQDYVMEAFNSTIDKKFLLWVVQGPQEGDASSSPIVAFAIASVIDNAEPPDAGILLRNVCSRGDMWTSVLFKVVLEYAIQKSKEPQIPLRHHSFLVQPISDEEIRLYNKATEELVGMKLLQTTVDHDPEIEDAKHFQTTQYLPLNSNDVSLTVQQKFPYEYEDLMLLPG